MSEFHDLSIKKGQQKTLKFPQTQGFRENLAHNLNIILRFLSIQYEPNFI